jgi:hypothetical protein
MRVQPFGQNADANREKRTTSPLGIRSTPPALLRLFSVPQTPLCWIAEKTMLDPSPTRSFKRFAPVKNLALQFHEG